MDFEASDCSELQYDHGRLLQERFAYLTAGEHAEILEWIKKGPNLVEFAEAKERWYGEQPSQDDLLQYANKWRRDRLALLRPSLPDEWEHEYQRLASTLGPASQVRPPMIGPITWFSESSPLSLDELRVMTIGDTVAYLRDWQPHDRLATDSREALARTLTSVVTSNPQSFAATAKDFMGLNPIFISALLQGFNNALVGGFAFDWVPIFDLSQWVLEEYGRQGNEGETGQNWGWVRQTIAGLLASGLEHGREGEIPFCFRSNVWSILKPLTDDPEPTQAYEARYGGENMDPATLSINTVRGKAMHAVMAYSLWVRRHSRKTIQEDEQTIGFNEMPEVRDILEIHLDPAHDPSPTIRSVYGWRLPLIFYLDSDWASQNMARIFPRDESLSELRQAAWNAYLAFNWPRDDVFMVLQEEYDRAVGDGATSQGERVGRLMELDVRLGKHLMMLYWQGKLQLDGPDALINHFFANAPSSDRVQALEFIGHTLDHNDSEVPEEVLGRLQALWAWRLNETIKSEELVLPAPELAAFGWWFISGKFEDDWAVMQLRRVLQLGIQIEPEHTIVERLADLAPTMPSLAVECLTLVFDNDADGWGIHRWKDSARTIVAIALQSSDEVAIRSATDLVNRLAARGNLAFRDLLPA